MIAERTTASRDLEYESKQTYVAHVGPSVQDFSKELHRSTGKVTQDQQKKISKDSGVYEFVESFSIIDSTKYGLGLLEIENSVEVDPRDVIKALLKTKRFEYIELEQSFTI